MNDEALAALKRAEAAYPNSAGVHLAYGDYDVSIGKDQAAGEAEWKQALGPARDNPQALDRLGELAMVQNKKSDALGYFKRLAEVVPNDPEVLGKLGQIQNLNSQFSDARVSYLQSFQLQRTPAALAGLGEADLELKNFKECAQVFGAIDKNAPDFLKEQPQLLYVYGKCAIGVSDKGTARSALTRFKVYVKPGTPLASEVDKTLASLGSGGSPSPTPKPKPKPKTSPSSH
jgi:tetratricopeptide (TPR) repeat protein